MTALNTAARVAEKVLFAATDPFAKFGRAIGMFRKNDAGATAIEYGLIAAGISVAIVAVVNGYCSGDRCKAGADRPPMTIQSK